MPTTAPVLVRAAALTRMSTPPNAAATSAAMCRTAWSSPVSQLTVITCPAASPPAASTAFLASSSLAASRATSATCAPSADKAFATASPIPRLPPVTTARFPTSSRSTSRSLHIRGPERPRLTLSPPQRDAGGRHPALVRDAALCYPFGRQCRMALWVPVVGRHWWAGGAGRGQGESAAEAEEGKGTPAAARRARRERARRGIRVRRDPRGQRARGHGGRRGDEGSLRWPAGRLFRNLDRAGERANAGLDPVGQPEPRRDAADVSDPIVARGLAARRADQARRAGTVAGARVGSRGHDRRRDERPPGGHRGPAVGRPGHRGPRTVGSGGRRELVGERRRLPARLDEAIRNSRRPQGRDRHRDRAPSPTSAPAGPRATAPAAGNRADRGVG